MLVTFGPDATPAASGRRRPAKSSRMCPHGAGDRPHPRNVALVGHAGNGKTMLAEALLVRAGVLSRMGSLESGTTASDVEEEERQRGQSLSMSVLPFRWGDHHVNLIDTPGYADFAGEVEAARRVADLLVFVVDAVGVQSEEIGRASCRERVCQYV